MAGSTVVPEVVPAERRPSADVEDGIDLETRKPATELPDENAQRGVQAAEAITLTWSKKSLVFIYLCMFSMYLVNAFQSNITNNLTAYVTSDFEQHSLIPVVSILTSVMGAACYIPIAKILNLWDRAVGFSLMTGIGVLGLVLMAVCQNIKTYCTAAVFTTVGLTGMIYSVDVVTADTSKLHNRGLAFAFTSSPYIITAFAGSKSAEGFYVTNWRWGFGTFAIVIPLVAMPMVATLVISRKKAQKQGLLIKGSSGRTWYQSLLHYAIELDLVGVILMALGLVLFLLPFSLAASTADQWRSGSIIGMLVMGFVILVLFGICERFVAPKPLIPFNLLTSRTVVAICLIDFCYQVAYYCWNSYYTSYLQVVYNVSISTAGYINSTFDIVSSIWLLVCGFLMRTTGRYKWLVLCAVPLYLLGSGLMIYFRNPHFSVGYIVMCQIFISLSGGTLILCQQVGIMSVAEHNDVAAMLALLGVAGNIGGAVGNSISGAIWTNTFPGALQKYLPDDVKADWEAIYDSLEVQLSYEMGSAAREGIMAAYAVTQRNMLIAGTSIMALSLVWMFFIKNTNLKGVQQVKGMLF